MKKVYLAGPDVFQPNAKGIGEALISLLDGLGMQGMFPLDNEIALGNDRVANGIKIAKANREMIHQCDGVLANLVPFRGPSADVGTVWECAYARGLSKIVVGYGFTHIEYRDGVIGEVPHDGMSVEDFGVWDNIMVVHGLHGFHRLFSEAAIKLKQLMGA